MTKRSSGYAVTAAALSALMGITSMVPLPASAAEPRQATPMTASATSVGALTLRWSHTETDNPRVAGCQSHLTINYDGAYRVIFRLAKRPAYLGTRITTYDELKEKSTFSSGYLDRSKPTFSSNIFSTKSAYGIATYDRNGQRLWSMVYDDTVFYCDRSYSLSLSDSD